MNTIQWLTGIISLFMGCELNFVFSAIMAGYLGQRLTFLLPAGAPVWAGAAFIVVLGLLGGALASANKETGYFVSGFLAGGFVASQVFSPTNLTIPFIPFIIGGVLTAIFTGLLKDWGLIVVSCLVGVFIIYGVLPLVGTAKTLASGGFFLVGGLVQVVLFQMQKHNSE